MKTWVKITGKFESTPFSPSRDLPAMRERFQGHGFLYWYAKLGGPEINEHRALYFHHLSPFLICRGLETAAVVKLRVGREWSFVPSAGNLISVHKFIIICAPFCLLQKQTLFFMPCTAPELSRRRELLGHVTPRLLALRGHGEYRLAAE